MVHRTSIVSPKAKIGRNVQIGAYSIIHDNVSIGDNTIVGSYCELGVATPLALKDDLNIGGDSVIRSHSVLYAGSQIGVKLHTGHYVTIRENSMIGDSCRLGSRSDIQGDCKIGHYTRMHADVHIGKLSNIGSYVWMFPEVLLTNDPTPPSEELKGVTIGDFAVLAAKVLVFPGVHIGTDAVVSAGSVVKGNVEEGKLVVGNPAKVICDAAILRGHSDPKLKAYPWRYRFHVGYDEDDISDWIKEADSKKEPL
jgi:acetyltransferase-like isoleucine patch superfamily enzyme